MTWKVSCAFIRLSYQGLIQHGADSLSSLLQAVCAEAPAKIKTWAEGCNECAMGIAAELLGARL